MDKKTALYLCSGCGIGEALDLEAVISAAEEDHKLDKTATHEFLCGEAGLKMIADDMAAEGINTICIGACSPRANVQAFAFGEALVERANLREQVAWAMPAGDEDTQMAAEDNVRMSLTKLEKISPPAPYMGPEGNVFSKDILVVGGGVAGMSAALEASRAGYKVTLLEKEDHLGGFGAKLKLSTPTKPPYQELETPVTGSLVEQVEADGNITVKLNAAIDKIDGGPGMFDAVIGGEKARFGSIIQATGWTPYDPAKLTHLGYGLTPDVITNVQLEEMAAAGDIKRPSDGEAPLAVGFIQCAGSRDPDHLPYCSAVCCRATMKHALYLKEQNPETAVFVVYKDVRTPGQDEEIYRQAQRAGVVFIRGEVEEVAEADGKLSILATDELLNDTVSLEELDMVVLATGLKPNAAIWLQEVDPTAPKEEGEEDAGGVKPKVKNSILKLGYRQGPDLPAQKYDFPDSHFICFPYETRRTGIYTAGTVRRPMTMSASIEDAAGAAMKAIQAVEAISLGRAVHPRAGDMSFPEFFMQRCTQCKRCTEECPFGAINEDEKGNPLPNPTRCRRCGVCMGACPERIISFKNYSVDMIGSMVKAINVPDEDEEKPRVLAFVCENDAYPALDMAGLKRMRLNPYVRIIPLRCLGSLNLVWIADALSSGIDGIILLGCRPGDDYQCHFIKGSELAEVRMSKIAETLNRLALESERVRVETVGITDWDRIPKIFEEFLETMEEVGPNPYKGF